ncbi:MULTISPECIES: hypothetical protein [unclassified Bradyrhizobium]
MIGSYGGGDSERGRGDDAQGQGPSDGDGGLTDGKHQRATGRSDKQLTDHAGAILKRRYSDTQCDEKR